MKYSIIISIVIIIFISCKEEKKYYNNQTRAEFVDSIIMEGEVMIVKAILQNDSIERARVLLPPYLVRSFRNSGNWDSVYLYSDGHLVITEKPFIIERWYKPIKKKRPTPAHINFTPDTLFTEFPLYVDSLIIYPVTDPVTEY